jgi:hypothetical protein
LSFITFFVLNNTTSYSGDFALSEGDTFRNLPIYYSNFKKATWGDDNLQKLSLQLNSVKPDHNKRAEQTSYISTFTVNEIEKQLLRLNEPIRINGLSLIPLNYVMRVHVIAKLADQSFDGDVDCNELFAKLIEHVNYICSLNLGRYLAVFNLTEARDYYSVAVYEKDTKRERGGAMTTLFMGKNIRLNFPIQQLNNKIELKEARYYGVFHIKYSRYLVLCASSLILMIISLIGVFSLKPRWLSIRFYENDRASINSLSIKGDVEQIAVSIDEFTG